MTDAAALEQLVALVGRRPGLRKQQLCDALDLSDEIVTNLLAKALLNSQIISKETRAKNDLILPEYHPLASGALNWGSAQNYGSAPADALEQKAAAAPTKRKPRAPAGEPVAASALVPDSAHSLAAFGSELINTRTLVGDSVAHLDSAPSAVSPLGGGGGLGIKDDEGQHLPLTWSIFADGQVGIFIKQGNALQQHLFLSQADVVGLYSFLSQTKPVWNLTQAKEPA